MNIRPTDTFPAAQDEAPSDNAAHASTRGGSGGRVKFYESLSTQQRLFSTPAPVFDLLRYSTRNRKKSKTGAGVENWRCVDTSRNRQETAGFSPTQG